MIISAILVAIAGGFGAVSRLLLDRAIRRRQTGSFPLGTLVINLTGSFLLGLFAGLVAHGLPEEFETIAGTGFLGGYTTFSTASVQTFRLLQERRYSDAIVNGLATWVVATILALVGFLLGRAVG